MTLGIAITALVIGIVALIGSIPGWAILVSEWQDLRRRRNRGPRLFGMRDEP